MPERLVLPKERVIYPLAERTDLSGCKRVVGIWTTETMSKYQKEGTPMRLITANTFWNIEKGIWWVKRSQQ